MVETPQREPDAVVGGQLPEPGHSGSIQRLRQTTCLLARLADEVKCLRQKDHVRPLPSGSFDQLFGLSNVALGNNNKIKLERLSKAEKWLVVSPALPIMLLLFNGVKKSTSVLVIWKHGEESWNKDIVHNIKKHVYLHVIGDIHLTDSCPTHAPVCCILHLARDFWNKSTRFKFGKSGKESTIKINTCDFFQDLESCLHFMSLKKGISKNKNSPRVRSKWQHVLN